MWYSCIARETVETAERPSPSVYAVYIRNTHLMGHALADVRCSVRLILCCYATISRLEFYKKSDVLVSYVYYDYDST